MISRRAIQSLDDLFDRVLREVCSAPGQGEPAVRGTAAPGDDQASSSASRTVACSISAFGFRLVVLFEYPSSPAAVDFLRTKFGIAASVPDAEVFADAGAELANMVCGAVKAQIANGGPDTGMSTPCIVDSRCRAYLAPLKPVHVGHREAVVNDEVRLWLSFAVCTSGRSEVDFELEVRATEEAAGGELELF